MSPTELTYIFQYGYVALFAVVVASEVTSFLPIGILLVALGAFAHHGYFNFLALLAVATLASSISDYIVFSIGRRVGRNEVYRRYVDGNRFATRIEEYLGRYPGATIFLSRLIGFASTPANAIAGLSQTSHDTFILFDLLGNALCALIYLTIGYFVGAAWAYDARIASFILLGIVLSSLVGFLTYRTITRS